MVESKSAADIAEWNALALGRGDVAEVITADIATLERRARREIQEYNLQSSGVGYALQGYALPDGTLPAVKAVAHLVITTAVHEAEEIKLKEK